MSDFYKPAAMWGLYNRWGYVVDVSSSRPDLMSLGSQYFHGVPWRTLRRNGAMSIRRVYVVPFVKETR
jgi:hypothetical protein